MIVKAIRTNIGLLFHIDSFLHISYLWPRSGRDTGIMVLDTIAREQYTISQISQFFIKEGKFDASI